MVVAQGGDVKTLHEMPRHPRTKTQTKHLNMPPHHLPPRNKLRAHSYVGERGSYAYASSQPQEVRSRVCSAKKESLGTNFPENEIFKGAGLLRVPAQWSRIHKTLNHLEPVVSTDNV